MNQNKLRVGFIGLGIMGSPMALRCLKAGFQVTVYNRTASKTAPHKAAGAAVAQSPAAVASLSDVVLICVTDTPDVLSVVLDEHRGIIAGVRSGTIVVDHSTVAPYVAKQCSEALAAKGAGFLDAPISGGDVGAQQGSLSIMVGGDKAHFDRVFPVLKVMGKTLTYCGASGAGYVVKLCNQICGGLHLIAAAEALVLAQTSGVDAEAMLRAVSSGAAGSWMLTHLAPKMIQGDYTPGFLVDYQRKDLRLAAETADALHLSLPGASLAEELFQAASAQKLGRKGTQAIFEVLRNFSVKYSRDQDSPSSTQTLCAT